MLGEFRQRCVAPGAIIGLVGEHVLQGKAPLISDHARREDRRARQRPRKAMGELCTATPSDLARRARLWPSAKALGPCCRFVPALPPCRRLQRFRRRIFAMRIPNGLSRLYIAQDKDPAGERAARALAERYRYVFNDGCRRVAMVLMILR